MGHERHNITLPKGLKEEITTTHLKGRGFSTLVKWLVQTFQHDKTLQSMWKDAQKNKS